MTDDCEHAGFPDFATEVLHAFNQAAGMWDANLRLVAWNQELLELGLFTRGTIREGIPLKQMLRDLTDRGFFHEQHPDEAVRERLDMAETRSVPLVEDLTNADGRVVELRRIFLRHGVIVTFSDVTTIRQNEVRARYAENLSLVGRVTGGLAHDFNNLLQVVTANLESAIAEMPSSPILEHIETAIEAAWAGAELTRTILGLVRDQPEVVESIDVAEAMRQICRFIPRVLPDNVVVETINEAEGFRVEVDRARLGAAILNLALNSRDAMPKGGRLQMILEPAELEGQKAIRIAVTDTGIGMEPHQLRNATQAFFTTKSDGYGTGLGLFEVHRFVKGAGGDVRIESTAGRGTTVSLFLPLTDKMPATDPFLRETPEPPHGRVLVVEDNDQVRRVIAWDLERMGLESVAVASGEEGWDVFQKEEISLIVSDVVLSGKLMGPDLVARIRETNPDMPVVFCTGYVDVPQVHLRSDDIVVKKPFRIRQLAEAVTVALTRGK